jgi:hypothetical protein
MQKYQGTIDMKYAVAAMLIFMLNIESESTALGLNWPHFCFTIIIWDCSRP